MLKQSMRQVLDIGRYCICVQIILAHCMLNKKYSLEILNYLFFSVARIACKTTLKKFGTTQFINSFRIAKRH